MPRQRTITCNNGCDPSHLEREDTHYDEKTNSPKVYRVYICGYCGWKAGWTLGRGLEIIFDGGYDGLTQFYFNREVKGRGWPEGYDD